MKAECGDYYKNTAEAQRQDQFQGGEAENMFSPPLKLRMGRIYMRKKIKKMLQVESCERRHKGKRLRGRGGGGGGEPICFSLSVKYITGNDKNRLKERVPHECPSSPPPTTHTYMRSLRTHA